MLLVLWALDWASANEFPVLWIDWVSACNTGIFYTSDDTLPRLLSFSDYYLWRIKTADCYIIVSFLPPEPELWALVRSGVIASSDDYLSISWILISSLTTASSPSENLGIKAYNFPKVSSLSWLWLNSSIMILLVSWQKVSKISLSTGWSDLLLARYRSLLIENGICSTERISHDLINCSTMIFKSALTNSLEQCSR
jgi:hypothetical protein